MDIGGVPPFGVYLRDSGTYGQRLAGLGWKRLVHPADHHWFLLTQVQKLPLDLESLANWYPRTCLCLDCRLGDYLGSWNLVRH